jgi:hypothetical protein
MLQAADVPDLLRKTAYIRLCCTVLSAETYSHLLQELFLCDEQWWRACDVCPEGLLVSTNPRLSALLQPLSHLQAEIAAPASALCSLEQGLKLSGHLLDATDELDALAGELQEEAEELKTIEQASRKQCRARSLN